MFWSKKKSHWSALSHPAVLKLIRLLQDVDPVQFAEDILFPLLLHQFFHTNLVCSGAAGSKELKIHKNIYNW